MTREQRWSHLSQLERKFYRNAIERYENILQVTEDVPTIAIRYNLSIEEVERAKYYVIGSGYKYNLVPDVDIAEAWERLSLGEGNDIDEIFLRHEVLESELVVNQGMEQPAAHQIANQQYPWGERLSESRRKYD